MTHDGATVIAMDAPPGKEDVGPYLRVAGMLEAVGVNAPRPVARNAEDGFLLLTDLGSTTYLEALGEPARAEALYRDAIAALVRIQAGGGDHVAALPPYDERLLRTEMRLFPDRLLARHLGIEPDARVAATLDSAADLSLLEAPEDEEDSNVG